MLFQILVNGLAMGSIYVLVAVSFVLIYRAIDVVNFATGDLVMLGAYLGVTAALYIGLPVWMTFVTAIAAMAVFGYLFERVGYAPLRGRPFVIVAISTLAIGIILGNGALVIWGPEPQRMPSLLTASTIKIGGVYVVSQHIIIIGVTALTLFLQYLLFNHTSIGRMLQATAQDQEAARLVGIRTKRIIVLTFILASVLAAIAGLLLTPIFYATPDMGFGLSLKGFSASIIGSFGSVPGALVGGILLGLIEFLSAGYISSEYKDVVVFAVMLLVLFVRPEGLLGELRGEKV